MMAVSSSALLRLGGVLAAGAAVAAAAGCGSSSGSSTAASSPASSAPASAAPSSGSAGSVTPGGTVAPAAGGGGSAAASCTTQDLKAALANGQGAAGSAYMNIDFTNTGSAACTLYGYPGVSLGTGSPFTQIGAAATRSTSGSPAVVTLSPGQTANALLRVTVAQNYPTATCSPKATTTLQVFPPNQTAPIDLAYKSTGCSSTSVKLLTIGAVQAGAGTGQ